MGVEESLLKIVAEQSLKFKNDPTLKSFNEALKNFDELVKMGVAEKRGNNLMPIEESHKKKFLFNSK